MLIRYFAWVRERTGRAEEDIEVPAGVTTVAELMDWLRQRGPEYEAAFERPKFIRSALDQTHVPHDTAIGEAKEIAFFPPMTGG
jgi:molybdopterin synthase sulfur carrier subunit